MDINKIKTYIGFSIRSGQVVYGLDNIMVCKKKIKLVVVSNSISENSLDKVKNVCEKKNLDMLLLSDSLENITKRNNCKVLGILNDELAKAIKNS